MTDKLDTVMPKIAPLLRMLSSGADGEVLSAAHALLRVLAGAGLDIHALVERIVNPPLSPSEIQKPLTKPMQKAMPPGSSKAAAAQASRSRWAYSLAASTAV